MKNFLFFILPILIGCGTVEIVVSGEVTHKVVNCAFPETAAQLEHCNVSGVDIDCQNPQNEIEVAVCLEN